METQVLHQNPHLKEVFTNATFVWDKPETINEISFERKSLIENHILMCGDTAGMIAPLCGNGMAIAIHSAKILAEIIIHNCSAGIDTQKRVLLEKSYLQQWNAQFAFRLKTGRAIQHLFGHDFLTQTAIAGLKMFPSLAKQIVKKTHGQPF
jgi:flavin-dependent dehydrogenase